MNETVPLRIDARLILEGILSALTVIILGIHQIGLDQNYALSAGLFLVALHTFVGRLLGKNATDAVELLSAKLDQALARNNVLVSAATPTVIRKADEAAASIAGTSGVVPPPVAPKT